MHKLILISAPSGTGKTTISRLLKTSDIKFKHVQVLTTRKIRETEKGRSEKIQVSIEDLKCLEKRGELINLNEKDGVWYGIKKTAILNPLNLNSAPILEWDLNKLEHFDTFCPTYKVVLEPESSKDNINRNKSENKDPEGNRIKGIEDETELIKSGYYDDKSDLRIINKKNAINDTVLKIRHSYFKSLNKMPLKNFRD